jgi:hypothetical protein
MSTGCPRPGPWRDALGHHRRFSEWYYLRVFELSASSAAAADDDDDDTTTTKPPTPPTTYRSLTCDTHQGRGDGREQEDGYTGKETKTMVKCWV